MQCKTSMQQKTTIHACNRKQPSMHATENNHPCMQQKTTIHACNRKQPSMRATENNHPCMRQKTTVRAFRNLRLPCMQSKLHANSHVIHVLDDVQIFFTAVDRIAATLMQGGIEQHCSQIFMTKQQQLC